MTEFDLLSLFCCVGTIFVIYGRGGSGKSRYQIGIVVEQLRTTKRNIVTNLAINLPRLNQYLEEQYPDEVIDVVGRVRLLTVTETREFWKYRGPQRWKPGTDYDLEDDPGANGVCYIIDEAGAAGFSALEWATKTQSSTRGVECTWYLDQQRKFGDDVVASTNGSTPAEIAKGFRAKAHEFIRLKNEYQAQWGMFRGRGRFVADHFIREPDKTTEAFKRTIFTIDEKGLASCYFTAQGVGVTGSVADIGKKAKGIPILWTLPLGVALASLCGIIPWLLGKGAGSFIGGAGTRAIEEKAGPLKRAGHVSQAKEQGPAKSADVPVATVAGVMIHDGQLRVAVLGRGWFAVSSAVGADLFLLSDGSLVRRSDVVQGGGVSAALAAAKENERKPAGSAGIPSPAG